MIEEIKKSCFLNPINRFQDARAMPLFDMEQYWDLLQQYHIRKPCRAHLCGPFGGDEIALRFVLQRLGFELEDSPFSGELGLVIRGMGCRSDVPLAAVVLEEAQLAPPLLKLAGKQFHLLSNGEEAARRRANIIRLLQSPESIELALSLIETGGMCIQLLTPFLLAWKKARHQGLSVSRLFLSLASQWLSASLAAIFDTREGDYHLGAFEKRFAGFSAYRFCQAVKAEGIPVFEMEPHMANLYAPEPGLQASAWLYFARKQPVVLTPHTLELLKFVPLESRKENLQEYLWLSHINDIGLLEEVLQQQPKLLEDISKLHIETWRQGLLSTLSPHLHALDQMALLCHPGFYSEELKDFLRKVPVYRLSIKADNATPKIQVSIAQWAAGYPHAHLVEQLHLSGFRQIGLEGLQHFKGLSRLLLPNNHIHRLPESIGHLPLLRELELSGNPITTLPDSFFHLRLHKLWIDLDQLSDISRYRVETTFSPAVLQRPYML